MFICWLYKTIYSVQSDIEERFEMQKGLHDLWIVLISGIFELLNTSALFCPTESATNQVIVQEMWILIMLTTTQVQV